MKFTEYSKAVVEEFLRTAVVVDDRAYVDTNELEVKIPKRKPGRLGVDRPSSVEAEPQEEVDRGDAHDESDRGRQATEPQEDAESDDAHDIDAEAVVRHFAQRSIFCTVVRPVLAGMDSLVEEVLPLGRHADIVILDWVLNPGGEGEGQETLELIEKLIEDAESRESVRERLRLIIIYTGTEDLEGVVDEISSRLSDVTAERVESCGDFGLGLSSLRVVVYAKPDSPIPEGTPAYARRTLPEDLPIRAIEEFAEMTAGLVSNTTIMSLTVLRNNIHRLLRTFRSELDAPYLAHRAMLPHPADAIDHLIQLISAEIHSLIRQDKVRETNDMEWIRAWLEEQLSNRHFGIIFQGNHEPDVDSVATLLEVGCEKRDVLPSKLSIPKLGRLARDHILTRAFHRIGDEHSEPGHKAEAEKLDREFAVLTSVHTQYTHRNPILTLGIVLKSEGTNGNDRYWLCMQPACDSIRLRGSRPFPLLPLQTAENGVDLIIPDTDVGSGFVALKITYAPYELQQKSFTPSEGENRIYFKEDPPSIQSDDGVVYRFVAELKFEQAQRIVNKYAANLSRVGLDESEWLRRY